MPAQVNNYQCPACTGPLRFDGTTGKLVCDYCGSAYTVAEIEALMGKKEEQAQATFADTQAKKKKEQQEAAQMGFSPDEVWGAGLNTYSCPSCGAELICDENTVATSCPYCGNPTVVPGQYAGGLKPDFVIPFKLDKKAAEAALKNHYKGKKFLPKSFTDQNHIEELKGVYVPFWLYDYDADTDMTFEGTISETHREGRDEVTNTQHYLVQRAGIVPMEKIPVDASSKMPDDYMDSIEPYNYDELVPFSAAYLPGFLADKYDEDKDKVKDRAEGRATEAAIQVIRSTATGYHTLVETSRDVRLNRKKVYYALMPVWLLSTRWNGNNYLFAMNGQTGKLVGDLPMDKGRYWATFGTVWGIAAAAVVVLSLFM